MFELDLEVKRKELAQALSIYKKYDCVREELLSYAMKNCSNGVPDISKFQDDAAWSLLERFVTTALPAIDAMAFQVNSYCELLLKLEEITKLVEHANNFSKTESNRVH